MINIFEGVTDKDALDLLSKLLVYDPEKRITPLKALAHPFFEEIRDPDKVFEEDVGFLYEFTEGNFL